MTKKLPLSRREFIKIGSLGIGGTALTAGGIQSKSKDFPSEGLLGRVADPKISLRAKPDVNSREVGALYEDTVLPWLREIVGNNPFRLNQRWVETPQGYVWSPLLQPVYNLTNLPQKELQQTSLGPGMWVKVTVPYVDVALDNVIPFAPSVKNRVERNLPVRLYYSQVIWVDKIKTDSSSQVWYRLNERYGYGDVFWGRAEAFKPLSAEEVSPINPEVEDKWVEVNLARQTLSCFEEGREVYFCRISSGQVGEDTETPIGSNFRIWRKMISTHMSGGTTGGGWDLAGVGFTTLFVGAGIAVHSTFWHNNYGEKTSRGCVNARPEDAQWIFRWSSPVVGYDPGDITVQDFSGTNIRVYEA